MICVLCATIMILYIKTGYTLLPPPQAMHIHSITTLIAPQTSASLSHQRHNKTYTSVRHITARIEANFNSSGYLSRDHLHNGSLLIVWR